jgi:hypothetical protein
VFRLTSKRIAGAADVEKHGEDRGRRRDEQPFVAGTAKRQVGSHFRRSDFANQFAIARMALDTVGSADPDVALDKKATGSINDLKRRSMISKQDMSRLLIRQGWSRRLGLIAAGSGA